MRMIKLTQSVAKTKVGPIWINPYKIIAVFEARYAEPAKTVINTEGRVYLVTETVKEVFEKL